MKANIQVLKANGPKPKKKEAVDAKKMGLGHNAMS